MLCNNFTKQT